ncbi:MAG: ABC transporter substrate-binding protein [Ghiorsea sp.]|nr:ABC transporter substrate-binding protein [Ghiorsea sp.]
MFRYFILFLLFVSVPNVALAVPEKVSVQLKWSDAFQFAGFYMALEKGYYLQAGLDVELLEGGAGQSPVEKVLNHQALYGISSTGALIDRSQGKPIKAVGVIFQYSPLVLTVLKGSGIEKWADFKGKRIMLQQGHLNIGLIAALKQSGLRQGDYVRQDINYHLDDLIQGKTDAYAAYATNQPYQLDAKGIRYRLFDPRDQGVKFYGDIIITSDEEVEKHPERVKAFVEASSQGWRYAFSHQDETVALILRQYNPQGLTADMLNFAANAARKYVMPDIVDPGYMTVFRWQKIAEIYKSQGLLPESFDVQDFIYLPQLSVAQFIQKHLWKILFIVLLLITFLVLVSLLILRKLVSKQAKKIADSEANYKQLLELVDVGIVVHRGSELLFVNAYIVHCFELNSAEDAYGRDLLTFVHPDERVKLSQRVREILHDGSSYSRVATRYLSNNGRVIEVEVSSIPTNYHGERAVLTVVVDVTERNKIIKTDKLMLAQMEQSKRLEYLGTLAGGIAHKFNNLLAVTLGEADIALYKLDQGKEGVDTSLKSIAKASEDAAVLCQQMLAYSGQGKWKLESLSLGEVVSNMQVLLATMMAKDMDTEYQIDGSCAFIEGDMMQIQQVIVSLVTNAVESIQGRGVVQIKVAELDVNEAYLYTCRHSGAEAGRYVYIEVADNGCGMNDEVTSKMFEPFYTTNFTGRGLGLSAVLGIVNAHGGAIDVSTKPCEGTVVRLLFPALTAPNEATSLQPANPCAEAAYSGLVLLVDDEEEVLQMGEGLLKNMGFDVLLANNGKEAVLQYQKHMSKIRLVLLDLTMPVMDGSKTFVALKALNKDVKIILCSGYNEQEIKHMFKPLKDAVFISKPYTTDTMKDTLARLFSSREK